MWCASYFHIEAYKWEACKSYVESRVIYHRGRGGPGLSVFQTDGSGWCMASLDESLMTESIDMVTIRWVKRMHEGSLMTKSINIVMIRWVRRMHDIPQRIPNDRVDWHRNNPIGQEDAWQILDDKVDRHGHNLMGQEDAWQIPDDGVNRHGGVCCMMSKKVPNDAFGNQRLF